MNKKYIFVLSAFITIILIYAPFHSGSYGFYVFLKLVVCGYSLYQVHRHLKSEKIFLMFPFALIAMLFQPFWTWGFDRETWAPIDFIVAGFFVVFMILDEVKQRRAGVGKEKN